jgi:hypothetical protein
MSKLNKTLRIMLFSVGLILLIVAVLWYPYESGVVPEWKLQVIDSEGHPVVNATAHQEWLDPIDEGITRADSQQTDSQGFAMFPKRVLHSRLALRFPADPSSAHIFVCLQDEYGDVFF